MNSVKEAHKKLTGPKKFLGWVGILIILAAVGVWGVAAFFEQGDVSGTTVIVLFLGGLVLCGVPIKDLIKAWRG